MEDWLMSNKLPHKISLKQIFTYQDQGLLVLIIFSQYWSKFWGYMNVYNHKHIDPNNCRK